MEPECGVENRQQPTVEVLPENSLRRAQCVEAWAVLAQAGLVTRTEGMALMTIDDECFDLTGNEPVLEFFSEKLPAKVASLIPRLDKRIGDLVVVREAGAYDHLLMEGSIRHTLSHCKTVPGYEAALAVGLDPLLDPASLPDGVSVIPLSTRHTRTVLWTASGTAFLYSEASAGAENIERVSPFILILCDLLEKMRPHRLHTVALSRLFRSSAGAGLVQNVVTSCVDEVIVGGKSMAMVGGSDDPMVWWPRTEGMARDDDR